MLCDSGRTEVWWRDVCRTTILWCGRCGVCGVFITKWGVFNSTLTLGVFGVTRQRAVYLELPVKEQYIFVPERSSRPVINS